MATSPSMVSGRVVDTATSPSNKQEETTSERLKNHQAQIECGIKKEYETLTLSLYRVSECNHGPKFHFSLVARNRQKSPAW